MKTAAEPHLESSIQITQGVVIGGVVILICSFFMILAMMHHPASHAKNLPEFIADVESFAAVNVVVHAGAIAIMLLLVFGFTWLSSCVGFHRSTVRLAMLTYSLGALSMVLAATVSGFLVPMFLERYTDANASDLEIASGVLGLLRDTNRVFDQLGVLAMSVGVMFWGIALFQRRNLNWITGAVGMAVGAIGVVGLVSGHFSATVHGVIAFVVLQGAWYILVAVQMIRQKI